MNRRRKLPITDQEFTQLLTTVRAELARQGFDAEADPEWESPIVDGCWAACIYFQNAPVRLASLKTLAVKFSIAKASRHLQVLNTLRRGDEAGARRESMPPTQTGLGPEVPLLDREVLAFVAALGRTRAARMLMMSPAKLRDLLDEIALRVRKGLAS